MPRRRTLQKKPPLAVGMGIYLPPSLQTPIVIGALLGYFLDKKISSTDKEKSDSAKKHGKLFASGLIVCESLTCVIIAGVVAVFIAIIAWFAKIVLNE